MAFAVEALGLTMWSRFRDFLRAALTHEWLAVRSGHKTSKSTALAALALWWFWRGGQVLATAPTATVVKEVWWAEVRRLARGSRVSFPTAALDPATGMTAEDGRRLYGYSTDAAERIAIRGGGWLFEVDEASGVHEDIFTALKGQAAGGARLVLVGNPTQPAGTFFDAFSKSATLYHTLHISSAESPNVTGEVAIPGLATSEWIRQCADDWGDKSPDYAIRVLGDFARGNAASVIKLERVLSAIEKHADGPTAFDESQPLHFGLDVAAYGDDDSAIASRRGLFMYGLCAWNGLGPVEVAAKAIEYIESIRRPGEQAFVNVDNCGMWGERVLARLQDSRLASDGLIVPLGINAAETAVTGNYPNVRSELWFIMRKWFEDGGRIVDDRKLQQELSAPTYETRNARGREEMCVEKKDDFKKRLKRSPDRADALALAVYTPASLGVQAQSGSPTTRWGEGAARSRGFG